MINIPYSVTLIELKRIQEILSIKSTYKEIEEETIKRIGDKETFDEKSMQFFQIAIKIDWATQLKGWSENHIRFEPLFEHHLTTLRFTKNEVMNFKNTFLEVLYEFYYKRLEQFWWM